MTDGTRSTTQASRAPATPAIDALLARLRRRLRALVWMHGLGRTLGPSALWLAFIFVVDWTMHVPSGVRLFHLLVLLGLPALLAWRELLRPLRRIPGPEGLAVLVERAHPELSELLVSAVEFARRPPAAGEDPALLARVVADAERRAAELGLERVLEPRRPRRDLALGAAAVLGCALLLASDPAASAVFLARIAGGSTPWPQRTQLSIEIPESGGRARVEVVEDEIHVRVARGSDVPVVVRAAGVVPEEVVLRFAGGHQTGVPGVGDATFRTLLRAVQEDTSFHATGGDDQDAEPRVRIRVLQPPDVAGLAVEIEPPAYSGLAPRTEHDRDVEVLAGSRLIVHVLPEPADARGVVRLLPEDRVLGLEPRPYPARAGAAAASERSGLAFELLAERELRYRFELEDDTGLSNPDPGLFAIRVLPDRPPEVEILAPGRAEVEAVSGGALPLRLRAQDDFGLAELRVLAWSGPERGEPAAASLDLPLEMRALAGEGRGAGAARAQAFAARRLELAELGGGNAPVEGQMLTLEVRATDNRAPKAQSGASTALRVRVVSGDEFLRRVQDRLARVRQDASALGEQMQEKLVGTRELIAGLESDQPGAALDASALGSALTSQRKLQGDARALTRELGSVAEGVLYSRLDERAGALLEELDRRLSAIPERGFHAEPWLALARLEAQGSLGQAVFASKLVGVVALAIEIGETHCERATEALRRAQETSDLAQAHEALLQATADQSLALARVETLLEQLAEWDNFQSVLALTRDILNRQKNLLERTRQFAKDN